MRVAYLPLLGAAGVALGLTELNGEAAGAAALVCFGFFASRLLRA